MKSIGAIVAVVLAGYAFLWSRKASADTAPDPEPPKPEPEPPKPESKAGPGDSGDDPIDVPTQGKWYRVKDGDNLSKIAQLAGLGGTSWRLIRDHFENAWMPQMYTDGRFFAGTAERALPLYRWFAAPGYKVDAQWRTTSTNVFPSIYIPVAK